MLSTVSGLYRKLHRCWAAHSSQTAPRVSACQPDSPTFPRDMLGHSCASLLANAQSLVLCHLGTQGLRPNLFALTPRTMLNTHY